MPPASGPLPRRSRPGSAVVPDVKKELAALAKRVAGKPEKHYPHTFASIFAAGLEVPTELTNVEAFAPLPSHLAWTIRPYADARREALTLVLAPSLETIAAAPLDTLASAEAMARHTQHGLLPAVSAARGLVDALRVASLANRVHTSSNRGYPVEVFFVPGVRYAHLGVQASTSLRHLVCAAASEDYERALAEARLLRDSFGLPTAQDPADHTATREEQQRGFHRAFFAFLVSRQLARERRDRHLPRGGGHPTLGAIGVREHPRRRPRSARESRFVSRARTCTTSPPPSRPRTR
ncbi:MAG: hypothetical protein R3B99_19365 [Polyangiales bacterium]